jgi:NtrC-family two-component system sensor histidine kinase KinB
VSAYADGMGGETAHELLNPITAIIGFSETLLDRWDMLDDDAKLSALRTIRRQGEQLKRLAESLSTAEFS